MSKQNIENTQIALALSGGGVRAIAFHAGVLQWLSEVGALEQVVALSTVSGGSIFTGLLLHIGKLNWPTSAQYRDSVLPRLRNLITRTSLQDSALRALFLKPVNWRYLFSRASVLAKTIESLWGIVARVADLPSHPQWSINGTTAETGVRFRVKGEFLGDYLDGYAEEPGFKLARALALSAAFPIDIGPLTINTRSLQWKRRTDSRDPNTTSHYKPPFRNLHIYDGGLYDNLGLEPFFDEGTEAFKPQESGPAINYLIVSDAGHALHKEELKGPFSLFRLKRLLDIPLAQVHALRIRAFVSSLRSAKVRGLYLRIGSTSDDVRPTSGGVGPTPDAGTYSGTDSGTNAGCDTGGNVPFESAATPPVRLTARESERAARYPTNLRRMSEADFDLVSRNGYETARRNWEAWHARPH